MLRRMGNKTKLLPQLLLLFPADMSCFIDLFMGSGAVTFAMIERVKHIFANDNDAEIYNLFQVVKNHSDELLEHVTMMPIHEKLFKEWKQQEEPDPIWQAVRFLFYSNFSLYGKGDTLNIRSGNDKQVLLRDIQNLFEKIQDVMFLCGDYRESLKKVSLWRDGEKPRAFIYSDPPYCNKVYNYQNGFLEEDTAELFQVLMDYGCRFGISELRGEFIESLCQQHHLIITSLGTRQTLKSRQEEIYISNYEPTHKQEELF